VIVIAVVEIVYENATSCVCGVTVQNGALAFVDENVIITLVADVPLVTSPAVSVEPALIVGVPVPLIVGIVPVKVTV